MFAYIKDSTFQYFIPQGTAFEIDGTQYPANWLNLSTPEEKAAVGIVDVVYGEQPSDVYYWISQDAPVYADGVVTVNYTATPKNFEACQASVVNALLATAYSILQPSDWMVVKAFETSTKIADTWNAWRAEIRSQTNAQRTAIYACKTVEQLASLPAIQWAHDPDYISTGV